MPPSSASKSLLFYDGDNGDFNDNDEENDQKTYKYYDFSIKNPNI